MNEIKIPSLHYKGEEPFNLTPFGQEQVIINPGDSFRVTHETDCSYYVDVPYVNNEGELVKKAFGFTKREDFYGRSYRDNFEYIEDIVNGG